MTSIQSLLTGQVFTLPYYHREGDVYRMEGKDVHDFIEENKLKPLRLNNKLKRKRIVRYYHGLYSAGVDKKSTAGAFDAHLERSAAIELYNAPGKDTGNEDLFFYDSETAIMEVTCNGFQL
jgi:hypothetical protein